MNLGTNISIFSIYYRGGEYNTAWISNQEATGVWGNVARVYADRCNIKKYTTVVDSLTVINEYDEKLLPLLDEIIKESSDKPKHFYTIHLMGTHSIYSERYPDNFQVFNADEEPAKDEKQREVQAEYDNAILYNDFIVNEIIKRFEAKDSIIIYISDHGESVFEDGKTRGHYFEEPSNVLFEIPMLVWISQEFRNKHSDLVERIFSARNQPFMTDDMIHALLDIMQIHTKDYDETRSLFSPNFNFNRKRIYDGHEYVTGKGFEN